MGDIKISVIVPIYNAKAYLEECFESLLAQTLKEIEIICINDGSTDDSLSVIRKYAKLDSRIVLINQENKGVGEARNVGIKNAKGDFIAFLDPDDTFPYKETLENLYKAALEQNVFICGGSFLEYNPGTGKVLYSHDGFYKGFDFEKDEVVLYKDYQFDYGFYRFIYKRKFLLENKLFFPKYSRYQDPVFMVKAFIKAQKFYALKQYTYKYRQGNGCSNLTEKKAFDLVCACNDILNLAKKYKLNKLYVLTLIGRLNTQYFNVLYSRMNESKRIQKKLKKINRNISYKIVKNYDPNFRNKLSPTSLMDNLMQNIFSVKNSSNKKHKVISILGIKIKFKRKK